MRRRITIRTLGAVLALLLIVTAGVLAGCSSNSGSSTSTNPNGGGEGQSGGGQTQSGTASVVMRNTTFNPSSLTVTLGTTVTWTNEDNTSHDVTFTDLDNVHSGTLNRGQTFTFTFTTTGTFHYYCTIHGAAMSGTVTVQ